MHGSSLTTGLSRLQLRANFARAAIIAVVATATANAIMIAVILSFPDSSHDWDIAIGQTFLSEVIADAWLVTEAASWFIVAFWIYQAHANLHLAGKTALQFTPSWAVGWYFVPIANLFKPFQVMAELWHRSRDSNGEYLDSAPFLLWAWWISWLLGLAYSDSEYWNGLDLVGAAFTSISAVTLLLILNSVTQAQHSMEINETFA